MFKWLPLSQTTALNVVAQHHQSAVYQPLYTPLAGQTLPRPLQYHELTITEKSNYRFVYPQVIAKRLMSIIVVEPAQS